MDAGSVHGITLGSKFTIYEDDDSFLKSSSLGMLVVSNVMSSTSLLSGEGTSDIHLVQPGIAVLSTGGADQTLAVLASYDETELPTTFRKAIRQSENKGIISLVDEKAVVKMRLENGHLVFDILDSFLNACGMDRVYYSAKPTDTAEDVARILSAGSTFFWHLTREHYHSIVGDIVVDFVELEVSEDEFDTTGYPIFSPSGENLLRDGIIDLYVHSVPKPYGIKLTNNSKWDLFPAAFYFDLSDWSICESWVIA